MSTPTTSNPDQLSIVPAATRDGGVPAIGWARIAMVLRPLQGQASATVVIELVAAGQIVIDWGRRVYWWTQQPAAFPTDPTVMRIRMARGDGADVPFMQEQPGRLDVLLWYVGLSAFPTSPAWWLGEGERYRLSAWPNFTELQHNPEDVRMTAMMASVPMSVAELAAMAAVEPVVATRLVNTLTLMGLLVVVPGAQTPPNLPTVAPTEKRASLFSRLRLRLAR